MTEAGSLDYLQAVLTRDPGAQAGEILELRRRRRSISAGSIPEAVRQGRDELRRQLSEISEALFDADAEELLERLAALQLGDYPELNRRAVRLRSIVSARDEIDAAAEDRDTNEEFFEFVKRVLAAPTPIAAELKYRAKRSHGTRRRSLAARQTVRHWKQRYPKLFQLDPTWLEELSRNHRRTSPVSFGTMLFIVIWVVFQALRYHFRD